MLRTIYVLLITALVLLGGAEIAVAESQLQERSSHALSGSYGSGCIYARDVAMTTDDLLSLDESSLQAFILSGSRYEIYLQPCTLEGKKNPNTLLPNEGHPIMPDVSLEEGAYHILLENYPEGGSTKVPIKLNVSGPLNGHLTIMIHLSYVDQGYSGFDDPTESTSPEPIHISPPEDKPLPPEKPVEPAEPPVSQGETPSAGDVNPAVPHEIAEERIVASEEPEPAGAEPVISATVSDVPTISGEGTANRETSNSLGFVFFGLAGVVALAFALSIASDFRVIRWFHQKKER